MTTETNKPLSLERNEKLQIFAVLSMTEDIPKRYIEEKKMILTLAAGYNQNEVVSVVRQGLKQEDVDPSLYTSLMIVGKDASEFINFNDKAKAAPIKMEFKKDSKEDIISYILYAFNLVGTKADMIVAKKVIEKFKK